MENFIAVLKAAFLGIVEGITEFIPVSSTGHLIVVERFIKLSENESFVASFHVIIQLGAILAVLVLFWKRLFPLGQGNEHLRKTLRLWILVVVGVIPAAVFGFLFDDFIEEKLFNPHVVAATLIFYGIILIFIEKIKKTQNAKFIDVNMIPIWAVIGIGFFQCLAMIPGTSRSGATIIGALLFGLSRAAAVEFSFFLAIPTMFGATLLKTVKNGLSFSSFEILLIGVGFVFSFVTAFAVIKLLINYISKNSFAVFGYYRIVFGLLIAGLCLFNVL